MNGYCECGCGEAAPLAPKSRGDRGWIKGQPVRFIKGHNTRTSERREWSRRSIERCRRMGAAHGMWKGNEVSYSTMHRARIPNERGTAADYGCAVCGGTARQWALNHSADNLRYENMRPFSTDPYDYDPLCVSCHKTADIKGGYRRG